MRPGRSGGPGLTVYTALPTLDTAAPTPVLPDSVATTERPVTLEHAEI